MKNHVYAIGPVEGHASTKTRARLLAETSAGQALNRMDQGPRFFVPPPGRTTVKAVVVWPAISGWSYGWVEGDNPVGREIVLTTGTFDECLWSAVRHTAMQTSPLEGQARTEWLDLIELWAAHILRDQSQAIVLRSEIRDYEAWQDRYRYWKVVGLGPHECHQRASEGYPEYPEGAAP
jgi:hypothetical protein